LVPRPNHKEKLTMTDTELTDGNVAVDEPMLAGWHNALTMDRYADGPPIALHAVAQPLVDAMWFQWRMTQHPKPTHITFRAHGNAAGIVGVVTEDSRF